MPFVNFITAQLEKIGLEVHEVISDAAVSAVVELDGEPSLVFLMTRGKNADGHSMIKLTCPGIRLTGDESIDGLMSLLLLRRHARMTTARWEVLDLDTGSEFFLGCILIANTMDAAELMESLRSMLAERKAMQKELQRHSIDF
jgi:hypothetical protein